MASKPVVNIALIGQKFMGRAHSNAWSQVLRFFDVPVIPIQHTVCGRSGAELEEFAPRWGWMHASTNWRKVVALGPIDLVDIAAPNHMHRRMALAALEAGKCVACEKPLGRTLDDARVLAQAARRHPRQRTYVWYNYRRTPAVALARLLVQAGRIGRIYHVRACYLQDWAAPEVPLIWRFDKKVAGSGSHGDLNAHIIDMVRFVTGQEIDEVCGAAFETFVRRRTLPRLSAPAASPGAPKAPAQGRGEGGRRRAGHRPAGRRGAGQL